MLSNVLYFGVIFLFCLSLFLFFIIILHVICNIYTSDEKGVPWVLYLKRTSCGTFYTWSGIALQTFSVCHFSENLIVANVG